MLRSYRAFWAARGKSDAHQPVASVLRDREMFLLRRSIC